MAVPNYPYKPGGPTLSFGPDFLVVPRIVHSNFDTEVTIADKVRKAIIFQGCNELEMQGYIQNEIDYARTNRLGLYAYDNGSIDRFQEDRAPGR